MKCTKCGQREANVFITKNINGKVTRQCLCDECAEHVDMREFDNIMSNMFSSHSRFFDDDFFKTDSFFDSFMPTFPSIGFITSEKGEGLDKTKEKKELSNNNGRTQKHSLGLKRFKVRRKEQKLTKGQQIEKLQKDLNLAVTEERYEDAAKIRDEINNLKK